MNDVDRALAALALEVPAEVRADVVAKVNAERFSRAEIGRLIDAVAVTVDGEHRANAPLLHRLQAMYAEAGPKASEKGGE